MRIFNYTTKIPYQEVREFDFKANENEIVKDFDGEDNGFENHFNVILYLNENLLTSGISIVKFNL